MQSLLVALILAACVVYTARRLWKRFRTKRYDDVRCAGCPLAATCDHDHEHTKAAPDCCGGGGKCDCCG